MGTQVGVEGHGKPALIAIVAQKSDFTRTEVLEESVQLRNARVQVPRFPSGEPGGITAEREVDLVRIVGGGGVDRLKLRIGAADSAKGAVKRVATSRGTV